MKEQVYIEGKWYDLEFLGLKTVFVRLPGVQMGWTMLKNQVQGYRLV